MTPEDCTTCGACCFSESPRHVRVSGDDHARLGDDADWLVEWIGNQAYLRLAPLGPVRACAALRAEPATGRFLCAVYERRPTTCRELERGSGACAGELDGKAERARRSLVVLRSA